MISFSRPAALLLLLLVPLYAILRRARVLGDDALPLTLGDWNGIPFRWSSPLMRACDLASRLASVAGFVCIVIAAAGPVRFRQEPVYSSSGTAIVFIVDVSPSMAARDLGAENRLDTSRRFIRSFLDGRPGDSFGLVAVGNEAALMVPPTSDRKVFLSRLDSLSIGELGDGTALGLALAVAAAHLVDRPRFRSCAILLTDGENNAGGIHPKTAAGVFAEKGIGLYIVGIGSGGEVPLDYVDPATGKRYAGMLDTGYNEASLREVAAKGGGTYISARDRNALESGFAGMDAAVASSASSWTRTVNEPLDGPCMVAAICLLFFVWLVRSAAMGALL